jgi:hypothetical protein
LVFKQQETISLRPYVRAYAVNAEGERKNALIRASAIGKLTYDKHTIFQCRSHLLGVDALMDMVSTPPNSNVMIMMMNTNHAVSAFFAQERSDVPKCQYIVSKPSSAKSNRSQEY